MILVAVGGNISGAGGATPQENCERALALMEINGIEILARSRWYRSSAWPPSDQPDYVNGVVRIEADGPPETLLRRLHDIEAEMGRVRGLPNMARVIDLDLLTFGRQIYGIQPDRDPERLRLPHPRLQDRAFVLFPLSEIAPTWTHPVSGMSIGDMIANLADDQNCLAIEQPVTNTKGH